MTIQGATALVTGANRGLGRHLAQQLRDRGANVYAGARKPGSVDLSGVTPVQLGIADLASVTAAAAAAKGVSILVDNAGIETGATRLNGDPGDIRREFDTSFFGPLAVTRAFAPQLGEHEESYILNVLSVLSWLNVPWLGGYAASKSAERALTNGIRQELAGQGTRVGALHVGFVDTDLAAGDVEILADEVSKNVRARLAGGVAALYAAFA